MNALDIVAQIRASGARLRLADDGSVQVAGSLPEELRTLARENREEIADVLRGRITGPAALAGEWHVSHHIYDGRTWIYMIRSDARHEAAWQKGLLDDGQAHKWTKEERLSPASGRKLSVIERDDGKAWEIERRDNR